jgi:hypothetical protein
MAGFFDTLFGGGAEREAADKNRALYNQYQGQGSGFLQTGYDTGTANLDKAVGAFQPLSNLATKYGGGTDMYLNALGLNGPQGNATASAAFQNNPGYTGAVTAGLDAINRRRGIGSMSNSGNADIDALTFGQNLQNQQYGGWLQNLSGLNQNALTATSGAAAGQAAGYGSLANLGTQYAENQVGLLGGTTSGLAGANNLQAQGEASGAKNLLGAGLSLATLAMGGAGGGIGSALGGAVKGLNLGQGLFGGGSPSGY